ncbi:hypothetical protein GXW82_31120 [Streptacidiphilus sp. 4-A2]|nr:hypothetical protein [Streptacidiphilus sp. 4-A2]
MADDRPQLEAGSGAVLGVDVVKAGKASTAPVGDVLLGNDEDNYRVAGISARNTAYFGVTGASAKAAKGKTATFRFSLYNSGPATLYDRSGGELSPA